QSPANAAGAPFGFDREQLQVFAEENAGRGQRESDDAIARERHDEVVGGRGTRDRLGVGFSVTERDPGLAAENQPPAVREVERRRRLDADRIAHGFSVRAATASQPRMRSPTVARRRPRSSIPFSTAGKAAAVATPRPLTCMTTMLPPAM